MQPHIHVGIMFAPQIKFQLHGSYQNKNTGAILEGEGLVEIRENTFWLSMAGETQPLELPLVFEPLDYQTAHFELKEVTIGINFHWERQEDQAFKGSLKIISENNLLTAINGLPLEDYLLSVISSEMSATSSPELLKAHAVISRSWLLAQKDKEQTLKKSGSYTSTQDLPGERIRWYDREDHLHFDVCADDHCQRYQGITKANTPQVEEAIKATFGQVLTFQHAICDARYSKCCGGISELFENCWEPIHHPYLSRVVDNVQEPEGFDTLLHDEAKAVNWITGMPEAFCNTTDKEVLRQVLNDYDQETNDFFRWQVTYTQQEIQELLKTRVGLDLGDIQDLEPLERGVSGRLIRLKIMGSKGEMTIGKELEIRKAFSKSHLYSSAFVVEKQDIRNNIPQRFIFKGAGWGHGAGLCQIGAAVMGARGYNYQEILAHYFTGAQIEKRY